MAIYHYCAVQREQDVENVMDGILIYKEPILSVEAYRRAKSDIADFSNLGSVENLSIRSLSVLHEEGGHQR